MKKIILKSNKKNTTESIRRVTNANSNRYIESKDIKDNYEFAFNSTGKGRISLFLNLLNIIKFNMNKKLLSGISIVLLLFVIGAGMVLLKRRGAPIAPSENKFAIENEINAEKNSFDRDINDLDELGSDMIIDDIDNDLSEINNDIKASLPPDIADLDAMEKELAYELDSFISDFSNSEGIENDASLNTLNSQINSISG